MLRKMFAVVLLALVWIGATVPSLTHANGVPQLVKLTYLDGISDFGPKDGEGVLEFSFAEAYARVEVKNLKPIAGYTYEGWLQGGPGKPFFVGLIPVQPSGVATVEQKLEGLDRYDYDLFVIAARPDAGPPGVLPAQKSIAGRFAVIADSRTGAAVGDVRPNTLPDTGQVAAGSGPDWGRVFRTVTVSAGVVLAAFGVVRSIRRRTAK